MNNIPDITSKIVKFILDKFDKYHKREVRNALINGIPGEEHILRDDDPYTDLTYIFSAICKAGRTVPDGKLILDYLIPKINIDSKTEVGASLKQQLDSLRKALLDELDQSDELETEREEPTVVFVNHERQMQSVLQTNLPKRFWVIDAPAGYGKTEFIKELFRRYKSWFTLHIELPRNQTISINYFINSVFQRLNKTPKVSIGDPTELGKEIAALILKNKKLKPQKKTALGNPYGYGIAIAIDNIEVLKDCDLCLAIQIAQGIYKGLLNSEFFHTNKLHFFFSGRYARSKVRDCSNGLGFANLSLEPFTLSDVTETIQSLAIKHNGGRLEQEHIQELAGHILYITGGHPGFMAQLLNGIIDGQFTQDAESLEKNTRLYQQQFIDEFNKQLNEWIDPDVIHLTGILKTLSPFRKYDHWLLKEFMIKKEMPADHDLEKLEANLLSTYLVNRQSGFLEDSITRALFEITLRTNEPDRFERLINTGEQVYQKIFKEHSVWRLDILAVELLFISLQKNYYVNKQRGKQLKQTMIELAISIVSQIKQPPDGRYVFDQFSALLRDDEDFRFRFNFYAREGEFDNNPFDDLCRALL